MKFYPQYLSFEVTRRCNLCCEHCMRGDSQCLDMDLSYVDKVLDDIVQLHYINFTGGEPSLNNACIKAIIDKIIQRNIEVYGFDVVTNGVDSDKISELIEILDNFKPYCYGRHKSTSRLAISKDDFHKSVTLPSTDTSFDICYKKDLDGILDLGRARSLNTSKLDKDTDSSITYRDYGKDTLMLFNSIVVSANGDIRLTVDYEYDSQEGVLGNISNDSLSNIMTTAIERYEESRKHYWAFGG